MGTKRKQPGTSGIEDTNGTNGEVPPAILPPATQVAKSTPKPAKVTRRAPARGKVDTNPDHNVEILDGQEALRASPDAEGPGEEFDPKKVNGRLPRRASARNPVKYEESSSLLSDAELDSEVETPASTPAKKVKKTPTKSSIAAKKASDEIKAFKAEQAATKAAAARKVKKEDDDEAFMPDPEAAEEGDGAEDIQTIKDEAARPPPVNSDYLPLPWKGRLGYACLNTYLRFSNPPVFSSRTCRIASIIEHRHPLKDPSQPEHPTKNRPDRDQPADIARGQKYVEELALANVRDIPKMLRWNDKYGIKFMRLSSEMFPFASHDVYGYKLAPFAAEALAEVGRVAAELGHRLTTHPGQFTQLGSPRAEVIRNAVRDLEYHSEMLSLLQLPEQQDRDAVMILHLGGTFGDKAATLQRFRENYAQLSDGIKKRLVLENDDVSWSVHDLLPLCEELNIPLVLDFHHHNIIFDSSQLREGTADIVALFPRIKATWDRKRIRQKMHYSEPCPEAITGRQRRKHNPRPATLPPCAADMDLMIEAKDKEQAVFELMRTFRLPGWDSFNNIIPYERRDDNKPLPKRAKKKKTKKQIREEVEAFGAEVPAVEEPVRVVVPEEEVGMGGVENRVYWPPGMEEWLRPKKREVKKKDDGKGGAEVKGEEGAEEEEEGEE
jgi:UV DNA damage endonuclease